VLLICSISMSTKYGDYSFFKGFFMGIGMLFPFCTFLGVMLVYGISSVAGLKPEYEKKAIGVTH